MMTVMDDLARQLMKNYRQWDLHNRFGAYRSVDHRGYPKFVLNGIFANRTHCNMLEEKMARMVKRHFPYARPATTRLLP